MMEPMKPNAKEDYRSSLLRPTYDLVALESLLEVVLGDDNDDPRHHVTDELSPLVHGHGERQLGHLRALQRAAQRDGALPLRRTHAKGREIPQYKEQQYIHRLSRDNALWKVTLFFFSLLPTTVLFLPGFYKVRVTAGNGMERERTILAMSNRQQEPIKNETTRKTDFHLIFIITYPMSSKLKQLDQPSAASSCQSLDTHSKQAKSAARTPAGACASVSCSSKSRIESTMAGPCTVNKSNWRWER